MGRLAWLLRGLAGVLGYLVRFVRASPGLLTFVALTIFFGNAQRFVGDHMITGDGHYTFLWGRTFAFDGDFDLRNDYNICGDFWNLGRAGPRPLNYWGIGDGILRVPFFWLGKLFVTLPPAASGAQRAGCVGPIAHTAMFGSAVFAAGALWAGFRLARRYVGDRAAWIAMLIVGLASPIVFYATTIASYNHASSALVSALFVERWDRHRGARRWHAWIVLGLLGGLVVCTRAQSGIVLFLPFAEWCISAVGDLRRRAWKTLVAHVGHGVIFTAAFSLAVFPQLWAWRATSGKWIGENHLGAYMSWGSPELGGPLFFPYSGLLSNNPLLWIAVVGMFLGALKQRTRTISIASLFCFAGTVYIVGSAWDWWGASGYPGRRFCEDTGVMVLGAGIGVAALLAWVARRPARATSAVLVGAALLGGLFSRTFPVATCGPHPANELHEVWTGAASREVHDQIGNPFSYPGALLFALRYRTHPARYDAMVPFIVTYEAPEGPELQRALMTVDLPEHALFFERGFARSNETVQGRAARVFCNKGRLLVPLFRGNIRSITVQWAFRSVDRELSWELSWNGERHTLTGAGAWTDTVVSLGPRTTRPGVNVAELTAPKMCVAIREIRFAK